MVLFHVYDFNFFIINTESLIFWLLFLLVTFSL